MSITSKTAPGGQPSQGIWSSLAPYFAPPIAAGISVIPVYRCFEIKTEQQLRPANIEQKQRDATSQKSIKEVLKMSCRAMSMNIKEGLKGGV